MHIVTAVLYLLAVMLYAQRSGHLYDSQNVAAIITRLGIGLVLAFNAVGFADLAFNSASYEWRHWLSAVAASMVVGGHIGLIRAGHPAS